MDAKPNRLSGTTCITKAIKGTLGFLACSALIWGSLSFAEPPAPSSSNSLSALTRPDAFTVKYEDGRFEQVRLDHQPTLGQGPGKSLGLETADGFSPIQEAMVNALRAPGVVRVEPIYYLSLEDAPGYTPADLRDGDKWRYLETNQQPLWPAYKNTLGAGIGKAGEIVVAIIDDGIHAGQRDLNVGPGYDFGDDDSDPTPPVPSMSADRNHGIHVAGIVGSKMDNAFSALGVYPGVRLMPLKVFSDSGSGDTAMLAEAIDYARLNGAHVINMSLSYGGYSEMVKAAIDRAVADGVILVAATGNDSNLWAIDSTYRERTDGEQAPATMGFPALHTGVIAVGAAQYKSGTVAISDYTNIGGTVTSNGATFTKGVDVVAPGSGIISTYYTALNPGLTVATKSGTSMASPHVAGLMALLRAQYPTLTPAQLVTALKDTASSAVVTPVIASGPTASDMMGQGLVQGAAALGYYLPQTLTVEGTQGLTTKPIAFSFNPLRKTQTLVLDEAFDTIQLTLGGARIASSTVNGVATTAGVSAALDTTSLPLTLTVTTTATAGHTETYTVEVVMADPANALLKGLYVPASGRLVPRSDFGDLYRVPDDVSGLYVAAMTEDAGATVTINGVAGKEGLVPLTTGSNTLAIVVKSQNTAVTASYSLTVVRDSTLQLLDSSFTYKNITGDSVGYLAFASGDFTALGDNNYSLFGTYDATGKTLSFEAAQDVYLMPLEVFMESGASASAWLTPVPQGTVKSLGLGAQRTAFGFRYGFGRYLNRVQVTLDANSGVSLDLASLSLSAGSLSPAFSGAATSYTATVDNAVSAVTVTAAKADLRAQLSIDGVIQTSKSVPLNVGANGVVISLIKDPGAYPGAVDSKTINLTITRSEAPPPPPVDPTPVPPPPAPAPAPVPAPAPAPAPVPAPVPAAPNLDSVVDEALKGPSGQQVVLDLKALEDATITLDAATIQKLRTAAAPVLMVLPEASIQLPKDIFSANASLQLQVSNANPSGTGGSIGDPVTITLESGGRPLTQFASPLSITLTFDPASLARSGVTSLSQLSAYYWDPYLRTWTYAGGRITASGQLTFQTRHLSTYAIRAYTASFKDIANHWAAADIVAVAEKRIAQGTSEGIFNPKGQLTNAQFITYLARALNLPHTTSPAPYGDAGAPSGSGPSASQEPWYTVYVNRAYASGLLSSVYGSSSLNTLRPNAPITRVQMAALLANAYSYKVAIPKGQLLVQTELTYKDSGNVNPLFRDDVALAAQLGLMGGLQNADGTISFQPQRGATRAEAMAVIRRLIRP